MTPYKLQILLTMALVLNVIGGKVSFFAAAREVKRENDGGEDEGDGEKIALNAFTGFSPPPPSRDIARCGGKGHTHSRPYRVRLSRDFSQPPQMGSLLAGYLLR